MLKMGAPARTKMVPDASAYLLHYGQTDGEAPERAWANTNPLAKTTMGMGPGSRSDALDEHFDNWNRLKKNRAECRRRELVDRKRRKRDAKCGVPRADAKKGSSNSHKIQGRLEARRAAESKPGAGTYCHQGKLCVSAESYQANQAILDEAALYQEERLRVARTTYHYNCQRLRITASGHGIGIERARFGLMFDRVKSSADSYMAHLQEFIRDRFVAWSLGEQVAQWRRDREAERRVIRVLQRQYLREQTLLRAHVSYDITCQYAQNNCLLSSLMSHEIQAVAPPGNLAADDVYACCALPFFPGRAFKGHDQHSAHANRYYYVIESGAYSSLTACLAALSLAPEPTPPVRVSTAEQAGHAWWSICRDRHPHCQARHAVAVTQPLQKATPHARRAPSLRMVGFTAVFKPHRPTRPQARASPNSTSSSSRLSDSESGTSSSSRRSGTVTSSTGSSLDATPAPIAPFLFVVVKTGAIYFDAYVSVLIAPTPNINGSLFSQEAHAESRRVGAKVIRVVRSFEEAVETIKDLMPIAD
ncbi:hypothetical protein C8R43DRAFT_961655 [Mycena crocata]|nr:hypothetical protein C8R43DRAFT_961655 [Mycena crocata]